MKHPGFGSQLFRRGDIRFHQRIPAGKTCGLYHFHRFHRTGAIAGIGPHPEKLEARGGCPLDPLFRGTLGQKEHPHAPLRQIGLNHLKIRLVRGSIGGTHLLIGAQSFAVAQLNILDARGQQAFYDALRQLQRKAVSHDIAAVPQRVVK